LGIGQEKLALVKRRKFLGYEGLKVIAANESNQVSFWGFEGKVKMSKACGALDQGRALKRKFGQEQGAGRHSQRDSPILAYQVEALKVAFP
jgi:hypothetical protein